MLDIAQKYTDKLRLKFADITYDLKYQFYTGGYSEEYKPSKDNWGNFEFVSINREGEILGHIYYSIDRSSNKVHGLCIVNFSDDKITFGRDVVQAIDDIFIKYKFRKLEYSVFVGNPIENTYDRLTKRYGGRIVGIKIKNSKLLDGELYDFKMYEIFREDYMLKQYKNKKGDNKNGTK